MRATDIKKVGVVGCGLMGSGIAEVCARSGVAVLVQEVDPAELTLSCQRVAEQLFFVDA